MYGADHATLGATVCAFNVVDAKKACPKKHRNHARLMRFEIFMIDRVTLMMRNYTKEWK